MSSASVASPSNPRLPAVSIVGTGYVGLVTAACLAERGHTVVCVDIDSDKVSAVQRGHVPIYEPGLAELVARHAGRRLLATLDVNYAVHQTDVTLITVGTPYAERGADLGQLREAVLAVGRALATKATYHVVGIKSTVPPGTTDGVVLPLLEAASRKPAGEAFGVGANPEFLTEGEALADFMAPDRIVLGGIDRRTIEGLDRVYATFPRVPRVRTNNRTAEMIKYASNALLAVAISFSNEIANFCAAFGGIDAVDVMHGVHLSKYLSPAGLSTGPVPLSSFLWPGCGFGGSCLPKDVRSLASQARALGLSTPLLSAVLTVNEQRPAEVLRHLSKHFASLVGVRVAVLGLSFRPNTDDMRESPAIPIVHGLLDCGAQVTAYDPAALDNAAKVFAGLPVALALDLEEALRDARAVVVVTRWPEFEQLPALVRRLEPPPVVIDGRRMLDPSSLPVYEGIGRS